MRMLVKVTIPTETGNKAIREGHLPKVMQQAFEDLKPEAAYFFSDNGQRCAYFFTDMKDPSQIPPIAEPFFMQLGATVQLIPVMNREDLQKGLEQASKRF